MKVKHLMVFVVFVILVSICIILSSNRTSNKDYVSDIRICVVLREQARFKYGVVAYAGSRFFIESDVFPYITGDSVYIDFNDKRSDVYYFVKGIHKGYKDGYKTRRID